MKERPAADAAERNAAIVSSHENWTARLMAIEYAPRISASHQMLRVVSSFIMRTTVDIEAPILREVKAMQAKEGRSMGAIVSELLADALARRRSARTRPAFRWTSRSMKARVDVSDKDAVYAALDAERS